MNTDCNVVQNQFLLVFTCCHFYLGCKFEHEEEKKREDNGFFYPFVESSQGSSGAFKPGSDVTEGDKTVVILSVGSQCFPSCHFTRTKLHRSTNTNKVCTVVASRL